MARQAVEKTMTALRGAGPALLRGSYWEHGKEQRRLQAAPGPGNAGSGDPHDLGLALDIVLFSDNDYERDLANQIVQVFLDMRDDMRWAAVIYNRREWNGRGDEFPRIWNPSKRGDRISFEHLTHIHIEWSAQNGDHDRFWIGLVNKLEFDVVDLGF
jgi:hypothetical protein